MTGAASPFGIIARTRRLLISIGIIGVILLALANLQETSVLANMSAGAAWFLLLAAAVTVLHFCLEPARWCYYLLGKTDRISVSFYLKNFYVYATTALMSYSLPFKLGIPLRLYFLNRYLMVGAARGVQIIAIDGVFNLGWWTLIALPIVLWIAPTQLAGNWPMLLVLVAAVLCVFAVSRTEKFRNLLTRWRNLDWAATMPTPAGLVFISSLLIVDILSYGVRHQLIAAAVLVDPPLTSVFLVGIVATYAGIASALPMGLGAYDVTFVALLSAAGVPVEQALLIGGLNRALNIGVSVLLGGVSSFRLSFSGRDLDANILEKP